MPSANFYKYLPQILPATVPIKNTYDNQPITTKAKIAQKLINTPSFFVFYTLLTTKLNVVIFN